MGTFNYGSDILAYAKFETTFGTSVVPATGDAFRADSLTMSEVVNRPIVTDRRGTRSAMETFEGRKSAQWAASVILRPGAIGTAPDIGDLLKAAMGSEVLVGGTSATYALVNDMTGLFLSIFRMDSDMQQFVTSAIVQTMTINWGNDQPLTLDFSGIAKSYGKVGYVLADGAGAATATLVVDDGSDLAVGGVVKIDSDDNSGAGYRIDALSGETATLDATATWDDNDPVTPHLPAGTFAGDPLYGTDGSVSLDGGSTTVKQLGGSVTLNTGIDLLNNVYGETNPSDVIVPGRREVTFDLNFLVQRDETHWQSDFAAKTAHDLQIHLGDTTAKQLQINMNKCELEPGEISSPQEGTTELSITGRALGTSGEDELELVFN